MFTPRRSRYFLNFRIGRRRSACLVGLSLVGLSLVDSLWAQPALAAPQARANGVSLTDVSQPSSKAPPTKRSTQKSSRNKARPTQAIQAPTKRSRAPRPAAASQNKQASPRSDIGLGASDLRALVPSRPKGLTADEVAKEALAHHPDIDVHRAELLAAAAQVDDTLAKFFPQITARASYARLSKAKVNLGGDGGGNIVGAANKGLLGVGPCPTGMGQCVVDSGGLPVQSAPLAFDIPDPPLNSFSLQASLSVPISDYFFTYKPAKIAALAKETGTQIQGQLIQRKIQGDARTAYYNWLRAIAQVEVTKLSKSQLQARLKDAKVALKAGVISPMEIRRLEALMARTQAGIETTQGFRELAAQHLAILMGRKDVPDYPAATAWISPPADPTLSNIERQVQYARKHRPEFRSLDAGISAVEQGQRATRSRFYPRLDGVADLTYANPNQRFFPVAAEWNASWQVGIALTWMVHQYPLAKAQKKSLQAQKQKLVAQRRALHRGIELEIRKAVLDLKSAKRSAKALRQSTAASAEAYKVATHQFSAGESTASDVIDAQSELTRAQLEEINALIDIQVAYLRLRIATGRPL